MIPVFISLKTVNFGIYATIKIKNKMRNAYKILARKHEGKRIQKT
jgi:hypothetical protein